LKSGTALGAVTPTSARVTNLPETAVVSVGLHDHISGAFVAGALSSGALLDSIGTSESLNSVLSKPVFDERLAAHGLAQGAIWIDEPINF
jgi:sugar (pentulose or hexulose) kinase